MKTQVLLTVCCCSLQWLVSAQTSLSDADRKVLLDVHNQFRRMVSPTASNMVKLEWDEGLENIAQDYAETCNFNHNPDRSSNQLQFQRVGENIYATTGTIDYSSAVEAWYNEVIDVGYDYDNRKCLGPDPTACLHYTQVVWAETVLVGCGVFRCSSVTSLSFGNVALLVCNYGPSGNINIDTTPPYLTGEPCSQCPGTYSICDNGLCTNTEPPSTGELDDTEATMQPSVRTPNPTTEPVTTNPTTGTITTNPTANPTTEPVTTNPTTGTFTTNPTPNPTTEPVTTNLTTGTITTNPTAKTASTDPSPDPDLVTTEPTSNPASTESTLITNRTPESTRVATTAEPTAATAEPTTATAGPTSDLDVDVPDSDYFDVPESNVDVELPTSDSDTSNTGSSPNTTQSTDDKSVDPRVAIAGETFNLNGSSSGGGGNETDSEVEPTPSTDGVSPSEAPESMNTTEPTGIIAMTEPPPEDVNTIEPTENIGTTEPPPEDVNTTEPADRLNPSRPLENTTTNGTQNEVETAGQGPRSGTCSNPSKNVEKTKKFSRRKSGHKSRSRSIPRSKQTKIGSSRCWPAAARNVSGMNRTISSDKTGNSDSNPAGKNSNSVPTGRQSAVEVGRSNKEQINVASNELETSKIKAHKQHKGGKKRKFKEHKNNKKRKNKKKGRKRRHIRRGEKHEIKYMYINN